MLDQDSSIGDGGRKRLKNKGAKIIRRSKNIKNGEYKVQIKNEPAIVVI